MKLSVASVVMAIVVGGTFSARAQNPEQGASVPKVGAPGDPAPQRTQTRRDAAGTYGDAGDAGDTGGNYGSSLPRIPSVLRNCEEPLPRYCQPYGSLFYWAPWRYHAHHRHHHHYRY
jgi:hypothetical protein